MPQRRILSLWFPRLAAERLIRSEPFLADVPFAVVEQTGNVQSLYSLAVSAQGLRRGMGLADARAVCPDLVTRANQPHRNTIFMAALRRWAGRYSPWVAIERDDALVMDISGCAHLFGGEEGLVARIEEDCAALALSHRTGVADTLGAAWAAARYAGHAAGTDRSGDAIDQEARATRSRAVKRGAIRSPAADSSPHHHRIIPPGQTRAALAPMPVSLLRIAPEVVATLTRLGLGTIGDAAALPRAALARRIGMEAMRRFDQALGVEPEPVSPARQDLHFACRLSLPDPIGLFDDLVAAVDRLLPPLCAKLETAAFGARRVRLTLFRADGSLQSFELGLARPSRDPDRIRPLIHLKLKDADAGYGIDVIRLEANVSEPLSPQQHKGHLEAAEHAKAQKSAGGSEDFETLMSQLGARIGLEAMTRLAPAESHIPEKAATVMSAAYSRPVDVWPDSYLERPVLIFAPEIVTPLEAGRPPVVFKWRRRIFHRSGARGPERIAPEWWIDDPAWRSGPRDYWQVETATGERLWLFEALGGETGGGWFAQGDFG